MAAGTAMRKRKPATAADELRELGLLSPEKLPSEAAEVPATAAVHFHEYRVDCGELQCDARLFAAQDAAGMWYGSFSVKWGGSLKLLHRKSHLVPSMATKYGTENMALHDASAQLLGWAESIAKDEQRIGAACLQTLRSAVREWETHVADHVAKREQAEAAGRPAVAEGAGSGDPRPARSKKKRVGSETQPTARPGSARGVDGATIVRVPLEKLHRHPANREIDPKTCKGLAESIKRRGMLQPIQVREPGERWGLPVGHLQIVFGERRYHAAKLAGWDDVPAIVVELSDAGTQAAITAENGQREQLNDIQRAERLAWDTRPVEEGGGGMTLTEAAQVMGISQPTASNLLSVAKLPEPWRGLIISGEIPGSSLRPVAKYAECKPIIELLWDEYQRSRDDQWDEGNWATRDRIERTVEEIIADQTRPVTASDCMGYEGKHHVGKLNWDGMTDRQLDDLQVVEIPVGKGGKTVNRVCNLVAWRKLEEEAERNGKGSSKAKGKRGAGVGSETQPTKKPTPAEVRAKEKEQDRQLLDRIQRPGGYREMAIRWALAQSLRAGEFGTDYVYDRLACCGRESQNSAHLDLHEWTYQAQRLLCLHKDPDCSPPGLERGNDYSCRPYDAYALEVVNETDLPWVRWTVAQLILWPESRGPKDRRLADPGTLPERWPYVIEESVWELAELAAAEVGQTWEAARAPGPARVWLRKFLSTHNRRQLELLTREIGYGDLGGGKLDDEVAKILEAHSAEFHTTLKLPALLEAPEQKKRGRPKK
jgi:ParB/RepB/Spo0J family partition protein